MGCVCGLDKMCEVTKQINWVSYSTLLKASHFVLCRLSRSTFNSMDSMSSEDALPLPLHQGEGEEEEEELHQGEGEDEELHAPLPLHQGEGEEEEEEWWYGESGLEDAVFQAFLLTDEDVRVAYAEFMMEQQRQQEMHAWHAGFHAATFAVDEEIVAEQAYYEAWANEITNQLVQTMNKIIRRLYNLIRRRCKLIRRR